MEISELENEIQKLKERNTKVEADKAWETSLVRGLILTLSTYVLVVILLFTIKNEHPFTNALVPAIGYFISFQSLSFFRKYWMKK